MSQNQSRSSIEHHEGRKYLHQIYDARDPKVTMTVYADVYEVLRAFKVTCPATQHAIKKLLTGGNRGKGSRLDDLKGAMAALNRAIDIEERSLAIELTDSFRVEPTEETPTPEPTASWRDCGMPGCERCAAERAARQAKENST